MITVVSLSFKAMLNISSSTRQFLEKYFSQIRYNELKYYKHLKHPFSLLWISSVCIFTSKFGIRFWIIFGQLIELKFGCVYRVRDIQYMSRFQFNVMKIKIADTIWWTTTAIYEPIHISIVSSVFLSKSNCTHSY